MSEEFTNVFYDCTIIFLLFLYDIVIDNMLLERVEDISIISCISFLAIVSFTKTRDSLFYHYFCIESNDKSLHP